MVGALAHPGLTRSKLQPRPGAVAPRGARQAVPFARAAPAQKPRRLIAWARSWRGPRYARAPRRARQRACGSYLAGRAALGFRTRTRTGGRGSSRSQAARTRPAAVAAPGRSALRGRLTPPPLMPLRAGTARRGRARAAAACDSPPQGPTAGLSRQESAAAAAGTATRPAAAKPTAHSPAYRRGDRRADRRPGQVLTTPWKSAYTDSRSGAELARWCSTWPAKARSTNGQRPGGFQITHIMLSATADTRH